MTEADQIADEMSFAGFPLSDGQKAVLADSLAFILEFTRSFAVAGCIAECDKEARDLGNNSEARNMARVLSERFEDF